MREKKVPPQHVGYGLSQTNDHKPFGVDQFSLTVSICSLFIWDDYAEYDRFLMLLLSSQKRLNRVCAMFLGITS